MIEKHFFKRNWFNLAVIEKLIFDETVELTQMFPVPQWAPNLRRLAW